jgi:hypothetical protein
LDIESNRPCINLTQIGDDIEDCYNTYDEKNTFILNVGVENMRGFHLRCGNDYILYPNTCNQQDNCTDILCSHYRDRQRSCFDRKDFVCLKDDYCQKNIWCNKKFDCLNVEDEYWCQYGTSDNQITYRYDKKQILRQRRESPLEIYYPTEAILEINENQLSESIINHRNNQSFKVHSYQCNRGIAVVEMNKTQCLCPPAYYGDRCQFFSDLKLILFSIIQSLIITNSMLFQYWKKARSSNINFIFSIHVLLKCLHIRNGVILIEVI